MKSLLAVAFLLISAQAFAYDQTFESCSLTAWSIFENLQQYQLHVPLEKLKATKCKDGVPKYATECTNVDTTYSMAKSAGIDTAYIAAHVHYIKCSDEVQSRVGRGPLPQLESGYRACARSSGARANILAAIKQGTPIEVTRDKMGAPYYDLIDTLYRKARDTNLTSVLDDSARAAVACIEAVEATERSSSEQSPDKTKEVLADHLDAAASGQVAGTAAESDWVQVAPKTSHGTIYFKRGGCELDRSAPSPVITCLVEFHTPKPEQIFHYFGSTTMELCIRGNGSVLLTHLDGTTVSRTDAVAGGNAIGDTIFEQLCIFAFKEMHTP